MRPTRPDAARSEAGFTLIEMIVVMTIISLLLAIVAVFIRRPMEGIIDTTRRAGLADAADTALRRVRRDIQRALPNSVRIQESPANSGIWYIEFIPTLNGGRYCADSNTSPSCNILDFTQTDSSFSYLGPAITYTAASSLVVYNLGIAGADAYAGSNRVGINGIASSIITLSSAFQFPLSAPGNRFQIVSQPVTYVCNPSTGQLMRYWNYGWNASQSTAVGSGSSALLANQVSLCGIDYTQAVIDQNGLLSMTLRLTQNSESVNLTHEIQIHNVP